MPYIGNQAGNRFVASKAASVYSGDGSTTAFTLEHAVGSDEDILVSVDGVVQEPSVAYAVSSGTTLTFTAAPSSNSGNNIFVYYLFRTVATVDHPSTSALSATSGTFSAGVSGTTGTFSAGVSGTTSTFTARSQIANNVPMWSGAYGGGLILKGNNATADRNAKLAIVDSSGDLAVEGITVDTNGHVTMPNQPAFLAQNASQQSNIGTGAVTIVFGTEIFDQNADFASNTFTAPVTGRYQLSLILNFKDIDQDIAGMDVAILTSNRGFYQSFDPDIFDQDAPFFCISMSILADMDASDTALCFVNRNSSGAGQTDIGTNSTFSGFLAC